MHTVDVEKFKIRIVHKMLTLGLPLRHPLIGICLQHQQLYYWPTLEAHICKHYPISSSVAPASCLEHSYGTPWGLHQVAKKYGEKSPIGHVFSSRQPTHLHYLDWLKIHPQADCITSRILWLKGLENGLNQGYTKNGVCCDSYNRYIYIHGTNDEQSVQNRIRSSQGCIRMLNTDIIDLFNHTPEGTYVHITNACDCK